MWQITHMNHSIAITLVNVISSFPPLHAEVRMGKVLIVRNVRNEGIPPSEVISLCEFGISISCRRLSTFFLLWKCAQGSEVAAGSPLKNLPPSRGWTLTSDWGEKILSGVARRHLSKHLIFQNRTCWRRRNPFTVFPRSSQRGEKKL